MPHAKTPDGVKLYYKEVGEGTPILFVQTTRTFVRPCCFCQGRGGFFAQS
jgi:hypothetical protein